MSSFVGHGLAAVTTYAAVSPARQPFTSVWGRRAWLCWLILIAWMPDVDHVVPALTMGHNNGLRITHTIPVSLLLPALTCLGLYGLRLYGFGLSRRTWQQCLWQSTLAGISHPLMDWFVGVIGLPLLWPFSQSVLHAPLGLLPSAGTPRWDNPYFWENLFIELGILLPAIGLLLGHRPWRQQKLSLGPTVCLSAIALFFLCWSMSLSR